MLGLGHGFELEIPGGGSVLGVLPDAAGRLLLDFIEVGDLFLELCDMGVEFDIDLVGLGPRPVAHHLEQLLLA